MNVRRFASSYTATAACCLGLSYTSFAQPFNDVLCAASYSGVRRLIAAAHWGAVTFDEHARRIIFQGFAIEVAGLCSGLRGIALWAAVAVHLPKTWPARARYFIAGLGALLVLNVVRIAHLLYLGGTHSPRFGLFHEYVWPAVFVAAVLIGRRASGGLRGREHAAVAGGTHA